MTTIYRKYRPSTFSDITGQEHIVQTLTNEITSGNLAHGFLFSGPRGVGKTTIARLLAKALNCENKKEKDFEPCNECSSCKEITTGKNIDVIEIDAASHTGVDNVRENIIENAQFKPTKSKYKVFIIDEVHMLSTSAFNALLKTLEEPPSHAIFILATTEKHKLLSTIISRCQNFGFQKISYDLMKKRLEKISKAEEIKIEKEVFDKIINKSDGCLRDAESLLGQVMSSGSKNITAKEVQMILPSSDVSQILNFIENILEKNIESALQIVKDIVDDGVNLDQFMHDLIEVLRSVMILKTSQNQILTIEYDKDNLKRINKIAKDLSFDYLILFLDKALVRKNDLKSCPVPQLPIEMLAIEIGADIKIQNTNDTPPPQLINKEEPKIKTENTSEEKLETKTSTVSNIKSAISNLSRNKEIKTTHSELQEYWPELITEISKINHSLTFILKMCEVNDLNSEGMEIGVPFALHQEKLEEKTTKKMIEENLEKKFNERIPIYSKLCEKFREKNTQGEKEDTQTVDALATEFGGEVLA